MTTGLRAAAGLSLALLLSGCATANGPAMRPHARAAAEAEAQRAESAPDPAGEPAAADPAAPSNVSDQPSRAGARSGRWAPPEAAGWESAPAPESAAIAASGWYFPVDGFEPDAVISRFGDPRDGGARSHEGIDILAPRGTPVLAPVGGRIIASANRGRGGNLVVLLDEYAEYEFVFTHLHSRAVARGDRVRAGDLLGTVGNTGNAASTPPHLHFEVRLASGPVDPYPLLLGSSSER